MKTYKLTKNQQVFVGDIREYDGDAYRAGAVHVSLKDGYMFGNRYDNKVFTSLAAFKRESVFTCDWEVVER
jgi:hypothetical protein